MIPTLGPTSPRPNGAGGGAAAARRSSSAVRGRSPSTRRRATTRISSKVALGILAFGRYSGRLTSAYIRETGMPLTRRQREILDYLSGHIADKGYAPSFEEIAGQFGFQSLATVHEHLTNLERKGFIRRSYNESRAIEVLPPRGTAVATEIPLLGKVAAGTPIEALMQQETLAVPDAMLPRRGPNY